VNRISCIYTFIVPDIALVISAPIINGLLPARPTNFNGLFSA